MFHAIRKESSHVFALLWKLNAHKKVNNLLASKCHIVKGNLALQFWIKRLLIKQIKKIARQNTEKYFEKWNKNNHSKLRLKVPAKKN